MPRAAAAETHSRFSPDFLAHVAELAALAAGASRSPSDACPTVRDCANCLACDDDPHEFESRFGGEMFDRMRMAMLENPSFQ